MICINQAELERRKNMAIKYENILIEATDKTQLSVKNIREKVEAAGVKGGKIYVVPDEKKAYCEDGKNDTVVVELLKK